MDQAALRKDVERSFAAELGAVLLLSEDMLRLGSTGIMSLKFPEHQFTKASRGWPRAWSGARRNAGPVAPTASDLHVLQTTRVSRRYGGREPFFLVSPASTGFARGRR